ncbi:MAG: AraC family transcriptional regulator [Lewinellaceae bacterium]|nr:AraC family transcriptional regulator [Lewinellaceae bacterium]
MLYQEFQPHPSLASFVENYWQITTTGEDNGVLEELIVPDGNASLMFIAETISRFASDNSKMDLKGQTLVVGQKSKPVYYHIGQKRALRSWGIRFKGAGLSAFTEVPQADLADEVVEGVNLFGKKVDEVHEQILVAPDDESRVKLLDRFLLGRLVPESWQLKMMDSLIKRIHACSGQDAVSDLATDFNLHHRQLERMFNQYVGLSPKAYARIVRFNKTIVLYDGLEPQSRLTDLAYAAGFFDQMHFIKEIKGFTRKTPTSYFKGEGGFFQPVLKELLSRRLGTGI